MKTLIKFCRTSTTTKKRTTTDEDEVAGNKQKVVKVYKREYLKEFRERTTANES